MSLYAAFLSLGGTIAGLGLDSSGVKSIADPSASEDPKLRAAIVKALKRLCWVAGIAGWLMAAALSYPLSSWTFGSPDRALALAALGGAIFLGTLTAGRTAMIQGMRRIGDLAKLNILGAALSTVISIWLYATLGQEGIVPALIATAVVQFGLSALFAHRIRIIDVPQSWSESANYARDLISLGFAFMYGALLAAILGLIIRIFIIRTIDIEANGIYQAAWALSGLFASFIISAMGADFFPRLVAVSHNNPEINRIVNEQTEIGVLLALPGLLATLAFAPLIMYIFYSEDFLSGANLLPWLALGVFGQLITFPLGYIQRAKGKTAWIIASQTHLNVLHLVLAIALIPNFGVVAAAWAFTIATYVHGIVVFLIARRLSCFTWEKSTVEIVVGSAAFIAVAFAIEWMELGTWAIVLTSLITIIGSIYALRGLTFRLGHDNALVQRLLLIPGASIMLRRRGRV